MEQGGGCRATFFNYRNRLGKPAAQNPVKCAVRPADPVLGAMRDAADEMDNIVAEAMRRRQ